MPFFIFIAGASGSGKSTLAHNLQDALIEAGQSVAVLSMDDYYKPRPSHITSPEGIKEYQAKTNFDTPAQFELTLFYQHLSCLNQSKTIEKPIYSFVAGSTQLDKTETFEPRDFIIIDNIFALHDFNHAPINQENSLKIFVESDRYFNYLDRRLVRDPAERGFTREAVLLHEKRFVGPGFFNFIVPSKRHADVIITNNYNPIASKGETKEMSNEHFIKEANRLSQEVIVKREALIKKQSFLNVLWHTITHPIYQISMTIFNDWILSDKTQTKLAPASSYICLWSRPEARQM